VQAKEHAAETWCHHATAHELAPGGKPWQYLLVPHDEVQGILLRHATHGTIVLDAKWKRPHGKLAEADLRQLFAYAQHYRGHGARLLYPQSGEEKSVEGVFMPKLFNAKMGLEEAIHCGASYLHVGQVAWLSDDGMVTDIDPAIGYLWCSIEDELPDWLQT